MSVPFIDLRRQYAEVGRAVEAAVGRVLASGRYILGPEVQALETELARYCGAAHGIGVASGTDALRLALEAAGVGPDDEVILPAFTFVATAEVVTQLGAVPVFADVEPGRLTIDPADVARRLTVRTKAVIPVHLYGRPADMAALADLAARHGFVLIEDAAQAIGAEYQGRRSGVLGDIACFSFFPTKNLGAYGDGGFVTTNDDALADRVRLLRHHGQRERYLHEAVGWCSRLDEIQAAALRVKLERLDAWTKARRAHAAAYRAALHDLPLGLPDEAPDERAVYHLFTVRTPRREELRKHLEARGVATAVHYPMPLHRQPLYRNVPAVGLDESERASEEVLSLPLFAELTEAERNEVVAAVRAFFVGSGSAA
jgi:dTDP-4-amino-4,6-dideoxygalactose transaminase